MTILAHNLYRLFAKDIDGYSHCEAKTIFNKFILNAGVISITENDITVKLKKKRTLPITLDQFSDMDSFGILGFMASDYSFPLLLICEAAKCASVALPSFQTI